MKRLAAVLALPGSLAALVACDRSTPLASCQDRLDGVYAIDGKRWMIIDNRIANQPRTLEIYPLFPDVPSPAPSFEGRTLEVIPRVIDIGPDLVGVVRRPYLHGTTGCTSKVPARITACAGDRVDIVLADPPPPASFRPCSQGRAESSRRETWTREIVARPL